MIFYTFFKTIVPLFSTGLWEGCFNNLQDANHNFDITISGCQYLLSEELYHLDDLIFQRKK